MNFYFLFELYPLVYTYCLHVENLSRVKFEVSFLLLFLQTIVIELILNNLKCEIDDSSINFVLSKHPTLALIQNFLDS